MTTTTFTFRATEEEAAIIREQAARQRASFSEVIRGAVVALAPRKRSRIGGRPGHALVFHPPGTPEITDADLDAAKADMC